MQYIKVSTIYPISFIRQDESWAKIVEWFKKYNVTFDITLDFENVGFSEPWTLPSFIELVKMKNVSFKLYHDEDLFKTITALFISEGEDTNRLYFEPAPKVVKLTNVEKKIKLNGEHFESLFKREGKQFCLRMREHYDSINHYQTIRFIEYAMHSIIEKEHAKSFLLDFKGIALDDSIIDTIGALISSMADAGIEVLVDLGTEEEYRHLALYEVAHTPVSNENRFKTFREAVTNTPNMVGVLTRYKHSDKLDEFGRQGKGESSVSRIAIFKGLKKNNKGVVVAVFQTFNINYFYTKFHWACEHDGEQLEKLEYSKVEVMLPELGFMNEFLGKRYHFSEISQGSVEESTYLAINTNGHVKTVKVTIPERAKLVFDDWGIKYNKEQLNERIKYTLDKLGLEGYTKQFEE